LTKCAVVTLITLRPSRSPRNKHLARPTFELREIQLRGRRPHRPWLQMSDPVGGNEQLTATNPGLQPGDRRQLIARIEPDDQILDTPQPLAAGVKQRTADQRR
jgi:hypothetical protein